MLAFQAQFEHSSSHLPMGLHFLYSASYSSFVVSFLFLYILFPCTPSFCILFLSLFYSLRVLQYFFHYFYVSLFAFVLKEFFFLFCFCV